MSFDSHKYARAFEHLACKIIEEELTESICASGITQKTRDEGIDSIIYTSDNFITIEAKLRQTFSSLGLKDVASSVIFYLLRLNDQHYIVTNAYLTADTINILDKLNTKKNCAIHYIDGDSTINALKKLIDKLDSEEKELAQILLSEFKNCKKIRKNRSSKKIIKQPIKLLDTQKAFLNLLFNDILNNKKCIIISGKIGTGKSTLAHITDNQMAEKYSTIFIDCQQYNTIESFIYQISNIQIGININELIQEYIHINESNSANILQQCDFSKVLTQVFSLNPYSDNIFFIAQEYIDNIFLRFNVHNVCIIIDNYSAASPELDKFISKYILKSMDNIKFIIVRDLDGHNISSTELEKIKRIPVNQNLFNEYTINELTNTEASIFIDLLCHNISDICKKNIYSYFGGNMLLIKLAVEEMKARNNFDSTRIRPFDCEKIYKIKLAEYIRENEIYLKVFFICWIFNSQLPQKFIPLIGDISVYNLLKATGFFSESRYELKICNECAYRVISEYYITHRAWLFAKIPDDFIAAIYNYELNPITKVRIDYFSKTSNFENTVRKTIPVFENKMEYSNIIETRVLFYLSVYNDSINEIKKIEAASDLLYEMIDYDYRCTPLNIEDLQITDILEEYFCFLEATYAFNELSVKEKSIISTSRIKYALFNYFRYKRDGKFQKANDTLHLPEYYINNCNDEIILMKLIRFRAICRKELGDKEGFYNILLEGVSKYPYNDYLKSVYYANLAADINKKTYREAFDIIENIALPSAKVTDKYLHLWLLNDRLIYGIQTGKLTEKEICDAYNSIMFISEHLCSETDKARVNNTFGAFHLKYNKDAETACKYFKNSVYLISKYENNNIMFYFAVNYLQIIPKESKDEFNEISVMLMKWCAKNIEYISKKIAELSQKERSGSKIIMAFYSFADVLKLRNISQYNILFQMKELKDILSNRVVMNNTFYFDEIPIILF